MTERLLRFVDFARLLEETFDLAAGSIRRDTRCDEVPGWDSLGHSVLLSRFMRLYRVEVAEADAAMAMTAGDLYDRLAAVSGASA